MSIHSFQKNTTGGSCRDHFAESAAGCRIERGDRGCNERHRPDQRSDQDRRPTALTGTYAQLGDEATFKPWLEARKEPKSAIVGADIAWGRNPGESFKLAAGDTSILLIEQNFSLVHRAAERYYVMSKGAAVEEGLLAGLTKESLKKQVAV